MKFIILLTLFSLLGYISAANVKCYVTGSVDTSYKPLFETAQSCANVQDSPRNATQCFKQTVSKDKDNVKKGVYYGCDYYNICSGVANGKCKSSNGVNTCCCDGDLCNSAGLASLFTAATVITAAKMLF